MTNKRINQKLISESELPQLQPKMSKLASIVAGIDWHDFQYKQFSIQPKINLSTYSLIILAPVLIVAHIQAAKTFSIPILQYVFVTFLIAFLINYLAILRTYELMPYLPHAGNDKRLKVMCIAFYAAIILSIFVGWNGSGGILFAIFWESMRGSRMGSYKYFFLSIIVGSIILENNYTISKVYQFIPGILFGLINTELSKLKASNPYALTHQFVFFCSMLLPVFFAAANLIVPSLLQWGVLIIGGFVMVFTVLITVKLMQNGRVSVVTGVVSGIIMLGTANYISSIDFVGLILIVGGIFAILQQEYHSAQY